MIAHYLAIFSRSSRRRFKHTALIWASCRFILLCAHEFDLQQSKFSHRAANGFQLFCGPDVQWLYPYFKPHGPKRASNRMNAMTPVNLFLTFLVLALERWHCSSGIPPKKKVSEILLIPRPYRFQHYFMISDLPRCKAQAPPWTWDRLIVVGIVVAVPIWLILHFGLIHSGNNSMTSIFRYGLSGITATAVSTAGAASNPFADDATPAIERTCFQTGRLGVKPAPALRFAIAYGIGPNLPSRIQTWREHGYAFMS